MTNSRCWYGYQQLVPEVKVGEPNEPPPTPPWLHGNSIGIDPPLRSVVAFFKWGSLKVLSPLASMISCRMVWRVVHTAPSFSGPWALKAVLTSAMRSPIALGVVRSCRDWMELKNPRSRMLRSGLLGRLVDELDAPTVSGALPVDVRVFV